LPKRILIADDDPSLVRILTHILENEGYKVLAENNGLTALETAQREKPDLLILDLMMPFLDGFGVLMRLYGTEPPFSAPAILLTAQDAVEYRGVAEALGAVRFLEKPFELQELIQVVRETLGVE
jgi:DNA-binding response OmpR family regulator